MPTVVDHAVIAVADLAKDGHLPTYAWLKQRFGRYQISEEVWRSLSRGRGILESVDQLDQYIYSYAPMVASQWEFVSKQLTCQASNGDERIIDYGCGQGLAGLLLHDYLGPDFLANVRHLILIEPSSVALQRAVAIYRAIAPSASIRPVNKSFNDLHIKDFTPAANSTTHLFSNVLDIDGYDHVDLLRKGLTLGNHTIIAVGHDRTVHGYSQGVQRVKTAVETGTISASATVHTSEVREFACGNRGEPAVMWLCKLEVSDG